MAKQYFRHDFNSRSEPNITDLRRNLGLNGYGLYWCLIEILFEQDGIINAKNIPGLAYDLHVEEKLVLDVLTNYKLFEFDNNNYFCPWIIDSLKIKNEKIEKLKINGSKGGKQKAKNKQIDSNDVANANHYGSNDIANQLNKTKSDKTKIKLNNFDSSNELSNNERLDSSLDALEILKEKLQDVKNENWENIDDGASFRFIDLMEKISYEKSITVGKITINTDQYLFDMLDIFRRREKDAADLIYSCFDAIDNSGAEIKNTFKYAISVFYNKAKGI